MNSLKSYFDDINKLCDKKNHSSDDIYEIYHMVISFIHFSSTNLNTYKSKLLTYIKNIDELLSKVSIIIENRILWCCNPKKTDEFKYISKIYDFKSKINSFLSEVLNTYKDFNLKYLKLSEIMNEINKFKLLDKDKFNDFEMYKNINKDINSLVIYEDDFKTLDSNFESLFNEIIKEYKEYRERTLTHQSVLYKFCEIDVKNISYSDLDLSFEK